MPPNMAHILQPADGNSPRLNPLLYNAGGGGGASSSSSKSSRAATPDSAAATCASTPVLPQTPLTADSVVTDGRSPATDYTVDTDATPPMTGDADAEADADDKRATANATASSSNNKSNLASSMSSKRLPKLSDIVAKYAKEDRDRPSSRSSDRDTSSTGVADENSTPLKGRLGLAGRLKSRSSSFSSDHATGNERSLDPRPAAEATSSGTSSPTKQSAGRSKHLPSLEEIHTLLQRKSIAKAEGAAVSDPDADRRASSPRASDAAATQDSQASMAQSPHKSAAALDDQEVSDAWDNMAEHPRRPIPGPNAFASMANRGRTSPQMRSSALMPPPASTKPLSSGSRPITSPVLGAGMPAPVPVNANASPSAAVIGGEHTHPLQHKWCLFYDSKSYNAASSSGLVDDGGAASAVDPTTPWLVQPAAAPGASGEASLPLPTTPRSPRAGRSGGNASSENWEATLKMIGAYRTVESFMGVFRSIKRPSTLEKHANYHLFKDNIKPMWEDASNANGGKWVITFAQHAVHPALLDRSWMWLVLGLIGEDFDPDDEVTGAVLSTRPKADRMAVWIREKGDVEKVNALGKRLVKMLELEREPGTSMEFAINNAGHGGFSHRRDGQTRQYWTFRGSSSVGGPSAGGFEGSGERRNDGHAGQGVGPAGLGSSSSTSTTGGGGGGGIIPNGGPNRSPATRGGPLGGRGSVGQTGGALGAPIGRIGAGGVSGPGSSGTGLLGRTGLSASTSGRW